jgi:mutator protein MutT
VLVGAILTRDAAILLGKRAAARAFYPGVWDVFGGHVEPHETPAQALVRELQEELGITPLAFAEVAVLDGIVDATTEPPARYAYHVYHVTQWRGAPENRQPAEHSEIRWVPLADVPGLDLASPAYLPLFHRLVAHDGAV